MTGEPHRFLNLRPLAGVSPAVRRAPTLTITNTGSLAARDAVARRRARTTGGVWTSFGTSFRVTEGASPFSKLQTPSQVSVAHGGVLPTG
jgi:hypothetical protein